MKPSTESMPWESLKAQFPIDDASAFWEAIGANQLKCPDGWYPLRTKQVLVMTDPPTHGEIAIFLVKGLPTKEDGEAIQRSLRECGAIIESPAPLNPNEPKANKSLSL